ncbi:MAG: type II toxin-antitoxin system RelE/ParE family toxin [Geminicoccales bacterium]
MKVEWLREARRNRESLLTYIAERNPAAAVRLGDAIAAAAARLANFPEIAPRGRVEGTRELLIAGTPYIAIYRVETSKIVILRLLHDSQSWPPEERR